MKTNHLLGALLLSTITFTAFGQNQSASNAPVSTATTSVDAKAKSDVDAAVKRGTGKSPEPADKNVGATT